MDKEKRDFESKFNISPSKRLYIHEKNEKVYPFKSKPADTLHIDKLTTGFAGILRDGSLFRFNTRIHKYRNLLPNEKYPRPQIKNKEERLELRENVNQLRDSIQVEEKRYTGELSSEKAYIHKCEEVKRQKIIDKEKKLTKEAIKNVIDDANNVKKIHNLTNNTIDSVFIDSIPGTNRFIRQKYHVWHSYVDPDEIPSDVITPDTSVVSDQDTIPGILYSDESDYYETDSDYD